MKILRKRSYLFDIQQNISKLKTVCISAQRMTGNVVYVCSGKTDASCKECGRVTEPVSQKQWAAIECNGGSGIQGRYVKVAATNSYLQLTEVEIYANGKFTFIKCCFVKVLQKYSELPRLGAANVNSCWDDIVKQN